MPRVLRSYQVDALAGIRDALTRHGSTICVLPTGTGKTSVASTLMNEWPGGNSLFLAHTRELVDQAAERLAGELGYQPTIEMGIRGGDEGIFYQGGMVCVGSVQSMLTDRRLKKYERYPFNLIVIDECFPAGTLIDGTPIESIAEGDTVTAFDPVSREMVPRRVTGLFRKPAPKTMIRITTASGAVVTATANHPFLTSEGWVNAGQIKVGSQLFRVRQGVRDSRRATATKDQKRLCRPSVVLAGVPRIAQTHLEQKRRMWAMWHCVPGCFAVATHSHRQKVAGLLLAEVRGAGASRKLEGEGVLRQSQGSSQTANAHRQPDETTGDPSEGVYVDAGGGAQAPHARREWARHDETGTTPIGRNGSESVRLEHTGWPSEWLSDALQDRPRKPGTKTGHRDRRRKSQVAKGACGRRAQGRVLECARVVRVEVLERGSAGGCDRVCPDGFVYNLEVEGEHTYLANGFAVHNCHRAVARSYGKVVEFFQKLNPLCKVVGLTATPNRADRVALGLAFETVGYSMDIPTAINGGWLVPIRERAVVVSDVQIDGPGRTNELGEKDFTDSQVEQVMTDEAALISTADPLVREADTRPTLVFCATVRHAHELAAVINRYAPNSAEAVDGETPMPVRLDLVKRFRAGQIQYLCNAQLFVEGFDAPNCSCVAIARPTKSVGRYTQMVGRALRPLPGVVDGVNLQEDDRRLNIATSDKPDALILDFVNAGQAGLVTIDDILGGDYDREVIDLAARARAEGDTSVSESQRRAKFLLALEKQSAEREHIRGDVQYQTFDRDGRPIAGSPVGTGHRGTITDGQMAFLISLGCTEQTAYTMSKRQAGAVIDSMKASRCTDKQRKVLARAGVNPDGIGVDRASRIIDAISSNGWRKPEVLPE